MLAYVTMHALLGGVYRARKFQEGLRAKGSPDAGIAMLIKQVSKNKKREIERILVVNI